MLQSFLHSLSSSGCHPAGTFCFQLGTVQSSIAGLSNQCVLLQNMVCWSQIWTHNWSIWSHNLSKHSLPNGGFSWAALKLEHWWGPDFSKTCDDVAKTSFWMKVISYHPNMYVLSLLSSMVVRANCFKSCIVYWTNIAVLIVY